VINWGNKVRRRQGIERKDGIAVQEMKKERRGA
jgi:hypothetical protein